MVNWISPNLKIYEFENSYDQPSHGLCIANSASGWNFSGSLFPIPGIWHRDFSFWAESKNTENPKSRGAGFKNLEKKPEIPGTGIKISKSRENLDFQDLENHKIPEIGIVFSAESESRRLAPKRPHTLKSTSRKFLDFSNMYRSQNDLKIYLKSI